MFRDRFLSNLRDNAETHSKKQPKHVTLDIFAPHSFDEYVGQDGAKDVIKIIIEAAQIENRILPNVMMTGPYGTGKTTLARLALSAYNGSSTVLDAASVNHTTPTKGTIIIDEIHNLSPETADSLNIILDEGKLSIIGCTTNPGMLSSAFRSRFRSVNLTPYAVKDIVTILTYVTSRKGYTSGRELIDIAARSRFNPRTGLNYLATIFDWMAVGNKRVMDQSLIDDVFTRLGVDRYGFTARDKQYLAAIPEDRPVGVQYISAVTNIDITTIETEVEPYLMQMGLIDRTPRGRIKLGDIPS